MSVNDTKARGHDHYKWQWELDSFGIHCREHRKRPERLSKFSPTLHCWTEQNTNELVRSTERETSTTNITFGDSPPLINVDTRTRTHSIRPPVLSSPHLQGITSAEGVAEAAFILLARLPLAVCSPLILHMQYSAAPSPSEATLRRPRGGSTAQGRCPHSTRHYYCTAVVYHTDATTAERPTPK